MKEYYSLLIIPPRSFSEQVMGLKSTLLSRLGAPYSGNNAPAHLSICSFSMKAGKSEAFVDCITSIVQTLPLLQLRTGKISSFPSSGTLFISISEPEMYTVFQNILVFELRTRFPSLKRSMSVPAKPHITLGKGFTSDVLKTLAEDMKEAVPEEDLIIPELRLMFKMDGKMKALHSWKLRE